METIKLALMDVDNTLRGGYFIWDFARFLKDNDYFRPESLGRMGDAYKQYRKESGSFAYTDFAGKWVTFFGQGIKGKKKSGVEELGRKYVESEESQRKTFRFTKDIVNYLNEKGFFTWAISASPGQVVLPFSENNNIRKTTATTYGSEGDIYTGNVDKTHAEGKFSKSLLVAQLMQSELGIKKDDVKHVLGNSFGLGDSRHDDFLRDVGGPFLIIPGWEKLDPELRDAANYYKYQICLQNGDVLSILESVLEKS